MAVYTKVSDGEIRKFVSSYDIGTVVFLHEIAEGIENSNFHLQTGTGDFILTLFEKRTNSGDLPFFVGLMEHLSSAGLPVPRPVCNKDGAFVMRLKDRDAVIVSFLPGRPVERTEPRHAFELGRVMAELHRTASGYQHRRANDLSTDGWVRTYRAIKGQESIYPGLSRKIENELSWLRRHWPENLPGGIIHADLFPDNVFFTGDHISGLIDFYFACSDMLSYDLAIAVNAWCFDESGHFRGDIASSLVSGYQQLRPLQENEKAAFNILLRGSALRFLLTRLYDALNPLQEALVTIKDPMEFLHILEFHQNHCLPEYL